MRILWVSNAGWAPQGYGVQVKGLLPHLVEMGHDVAVFAFYGLEGGKVELPIDGADGVTLTHYPRLLDPYGNDAVALHARDWEADVVITLMDVWVLDPRQLQNLNWLAWLPVDQEPLPEAVLGRLPFMKRAIPYSRFGEHLIQATGVPCTYIPHGVDTRIFQPFPAEGRAKAKTALGFEETDFVVGMVGANKGFPSRKGFPEAFQAFAKLRESVPSARLYVHSHVSSAYGGPDLARLAELCGIAAYTRFGDQYQMAIGGLPAEAMAIIYNAFDVLLHPSLNEGFGIPLLEAQACGTPVIATEGTSMTELVAPGGRVVSPAQKQLSAQMSWVAVPDVDEFAFCLENVHYDLTHKPAHQALFRDPRAEARQFALGFDWKLLAENFWRPLLDQVAEEIGAAKSRPRPQPITRQPFTTPTQMYDETFRQDLAAAVAFDEERLAAENAEATQATMERAAELVGVGPITRDLGEIRSPHNPDGEMTHFIVPPTSVEDWQSLGVNFHGGGGHGQ